MERIRSIDFVIVYARVRPIGALLLLKGITHALADAWGAVMIGQRMLTTAPPISRPLGLAAYS